MKTKNAATHTLGHRFQFVKTLKNCQVRALYSEGTTDAFYSIIYEGVESEARLIAAAPDMKDALLLAHRNEILRWELSGCAAREQDRSRATLEAIRINRENAKAYRDEIQANMRIIRAAIAKAEVL